MEEAYLIFDIGTGNSRAAVVSAGGTILSVAKGNSIVHLDRQVKGASYFLPQEWEAAIWRLARKALAGAGSGVRVTSVCASSLREAVVLVDRQGESIIGYTNSDRRGEAFMHELDWERIWELTDLSPSPIFSAIKILGTARREPEVLERTAFYTSVSDWVGYLFTGVGVWERAQAMQSAVYDPMTGSWSEELCGLTGGIDSTQLPPLADAGSVLGPVRPAVCQELGLAPGTRFIVGTADTQAALTGAGGELGDTVIVSGTTSPCLKVIPAFRKYPLTWVSPTAERDRFMLEVNTTSSGINLQRYKDAMLPEVSYAHLDQDAIALGLPEEGLPPCFAMFQRGMHLDRDCLTGGFLMRVPFSPELRQESFFHALSLNIGMGITLCLQRIDQLDGLEKDYLVGCGGGFTSPIIGQTVADLTGRPIRLPVTFREATVHGCAALCRRAAGTEGTGPALLREILPKPAPALEDYFAQWQHCRQKLQEIEL